MQEGIPCPWKGILVSAVDVKPTDPQLTAQSLCAHRQMSRAHFDNAQVVFDQGGRLVHIFDQTGIGE